MEKTLGGKTEVEDAVGENLFEGTVQIYESILQLGALNQRDTFKVWWIVAWFAIAKNVSRKFFSCYLHGHYNSNS